MNKPALSPYGLWLKHKKLLNEPMSKIISELWVEFEQQQKLMMKMTESALTKPIVMLDCVKVNDLVYNAANVEALIKNAAASFKKLKQFDTAIELLEACSEDLFISGEDADLESRVDSFIKEVKS